MMHRRNTKRLGAIVPMVALSLIPLMGLLALAIDIGMVAVSRSQCQNAADSAAMAGARTLNGNVQSNYNFAAVPANAIKAAVANKVLNQNVQGDPANPTPEGNGYTFTSKEVKVEIGTFAYEYNNNDSNKEGFKLAFPRIDSSEPYSAVRATVTHTVNLAFGRIFGMSTLNTSATATAAHRPRDVIIILDLSGSMRFQSLPGIPLTSGGAANPSSTSSPRVVSMNPESVFPQFGHYSDVSAAALQGTSSYFTGTEYVDPANISTSTHSGSPIIEDFFQNSAGAAPSPGNRAFFRAPDFQDVAPGGYNYLKTNGNAGGTFATTVFDILSKSTFDANFEIKGYDQYQAPNPSFYTEGPGYWGKTFFIWPPDPRDPAPGLDANNPANHRNNGARDWRQRFFFKVNNSTGKLGWLDHNNILFNPSGAPATTSNPKPTPILKTPGTTTTVTENGSSVTYSYRINYAAIFEWLQNEAPVHFPGQIRAGRIKYYDAIPDPGDTTLNSRFWTTATLGNLNERFWKGYIDFVLGLKGTGAGTYTNTQNNVPLTGFIGNGDFFPWGTVQVKQKPDVTSSSTAYQTGAVNHSGGYASGFNGAITVSGLTSLPLVGDYVYLGSSSTRYRIKTATSRTSITLDQPLSAAVANSTTVKFVQGPYMDYRDNPFRPRHQFWFGPMTWVDWLGNYNTNQFWWPGNVHEAQGWACKVGIQSAIDDIKNNHPGDFIGMAYFSSPDYGSSSSGSWNRAIVPLGRNYQQLKDSLWFPPSTVTGAAKEITPFDADFAQVPRAKGGTCPGMGFMISYNLLSSSANLRFYSQPQPLYYGNAGGLGRKGAQRVIIFETDGAPNTRAVANLADSGKDSYYRIRLADPTDFDSSSNVEFPTGGSYSDQDVYDVVAQIGKLDTASPPGFSTSRKKVEVHPIGYGSIFDPSNGSSGQTKALAFLQTIAFLGNTASDTNAASFPDSRRIYGSNQQRIDRIRNAFSEIMQSGYQVSMIE